MASLQYVIDSLCSKVTVESIYRIIKHRLDQGPFNNTDIIPSIRNEDHSLDYDSARKIAEAALEEMVQKKKVRIDGSLILSVK